MDDRQWYKEHNLIYPLWKTDTKYSRSQNVQYCKKCKDTAFELLLDKKPQGNCCRCGEKFT